MEYTKEQKEKLAELDRQEEKRMAVLKHLEVCGSCQQTQYEGIKFCRTGRRLYNAQWK